MSLHSERAGEEVNYATADTPNFTDAERSAFNAAIDANPFDATNHLVYADWLQEHGQEDEADFRRLWGQWIGEHDLSTRDTGRTVGRHPATTGVSLEYQPHTENPWRVYGHYGPVEGSKVSSLADRLGVPDYHNGTLIGLMTDGVNSVGPVITTLHQYRNLAGDVPSHVALWNNDPGSMSWRTYRDMENAYRHVFMTNRRKSAEQSSQQNLSRYSSLGDVMTPEQAELRQLHSALSMLCDQFSHLATGRTAPTDYVPHDFEPDPEYTFQYEPGLMPPTPPARPAYPLKPTKPGGDSVRRRIDRPEPVNPTMPNVNPDAQSVWDQPFNPLGHDIDPETGLWQLPYDEFPSAPMAGYGPSAPSQPDPLDPIRQRFTQLTQQGQAGELDFTLAEIQQLENQLGPAESDRIRQQVWTQRQRNRRSRQRPAASVPTVAPGANSPTGYADDQGFVQRIRSQPWDATSHGAYADWLEENGNPQQADSHRAMMDWLLSGPRVVTVARDGSRTAGRYPIFITSEYTAAPRGDGNWTWRRTASYGQTTSGRAPTGPMIARAQSYADQQGIPYLPGIRHGYPVDWEQLMSHHGITLPPDEVQPETDLPLPVQSAAYGQPSSHADISSAKARQILHDGTVHGHPLTHKQRGFFGAIAGRSDSSRYRRGPQLRNPTTAWVTPDESLWHGRSGKSTYADDERRPSGAWNRTVTAPPARTSPTDEDVRGYNPQAPTLYPPRPKRTDRPMVGRNWGGLFAAGTSYVYKPPFDPARMTEQERQRMHTWRIPPTRRPYAAYDHMGDDCGYPASVPHTPTDDLAACFADLAHQIAAMRFGAQYCSHYHSGEPSYGDDSGGFGGPSFTPEFVQSQPEYSPYGRGRL